MIFFNVKVNYFLKLSKRATTDVMALLDVPRTRLELACCKPAPAPQAGVSTNSTIWAINYF